jgi:hypothetical protein
MIRGLLVLAFCAKNSYNITMELEKKKLVQHRKPNGTIYVYEVVENYWDKEKQQARNRQVCLGKLDADTDEFIPSKRFGKHAKPAMDEAITAHTTVSGPVLILEKINTDIQLSRYLKKAAPEDYAEILSLAYYLVCTGDCLSHAATWCNNHEVPARKSLESQRISELLARIDDDVIQTFFKAWGKAKSKKETLCYDITSVSSYSELNEYVRYGYNRDREPLPQINLALLYAKESVLPLAYRYLPGSITDVTTLENLLDQLQKLDYPKVQFIMDRGFYSKKNIEQLLSKKYHFTLGVPTHIKWVREEIDKHREEIDSPLGFRQVGDSVVYVHSQLYHWPGSRRRLYLHLYFDPNKQADDRVKFDLYIAQLMDELKNEKHVEDHEPHYTQFFHCKKTPKRGLQVEMDWEAITAARNEYVGYQAILSTRIKDTLQALQIYREKDVVEKCFSDLKNQLDMKRLRVHRYPMMKGRLFIQFIAMIILSQIRNVLREQKELASYTARCLLKEMESLTTIHYSGTYKDKHSEVTKRQREILAAFNLQLE